MKVKKIEVWKERFELSRPYTIAFRSIDVVENVVVKLSSDSGIIGLGTASPERFVTGETIEATESAIAQTALQWLEDTEVDLEKLLPMAKQKYFKTPAARAAVDMALYDLAAQEKNVPLCQMLGQVHHKLPTSITIGIKGVEETLKEAKEYIERGFKVLKVKLGKDPALDLERCVKLRELVGTDVLIRLDMNQGYTKDQLLEFWKKTVSLNIEFVEQPMAAGDLTSLEQLPKDIQEKIAADESLLSTEDAKRLVNPNPRCGIFNIKLMKCGGISTALEIADVAKQNGLSLMWGCMDESRVGIAAALHAAFACESTRYLDLDGSLDLGRDIVRGGFEISNGEMTLSNRPGLGVELI